MAQAASRDGGHFVAATPTVDWNQIENARPDVLGPALHAQKAGDRPVAAAPGGRDGDHRLRCQPAALGQSCFATPQAVGKGLGRLTHLLPNRRASPAPRHPLGVCERCKAWKPSCTWHSCSVRQVPQPCSQAWHIPTSRSLSRTSSTLLPACRTPSTAAGRTGGGEPILVRAAVDDKSIHAHPFLDYRRIPVLAWDQRPPAFRLRIAPGACHHTTRGARRQVKRETSRPRQLRRTACAIRTWLAPYATRAEGCQRETRRQKQAG